MIVKLPLPLKANSNLAQRMVNSLYLQEALITLIEAEDSLYDYYLDDSEIDYDEVEVVRTTRSLILELMEDFSINE